MFLSKPRFRVNEEEDSHVCLCIYKFGLSSWVPIVSLSKLGLIDTTKASTHNQTCLSKTVVFSPVTLVVPFRSSHSKIRSQFCKKNWI